MGIKDRGRLHQSSSKNSCLGKGIIRENSAWKQVHKRDIKNLGRIHGWRRGITRKTPACEQEY